MAFAILGEAFLLLAFAMLAAGEPHGSLRIPDVVAALPGSPWRDAALALLIAGFGAKMGLVPLNGWMPLTYAATPIPAAAVLSGAGVKAGVIGLIRFLPLGAPARGLGRGARGHRLRDRLLRRRGRRHAAQSKGGARLFEREPDGRHRRRARHGARRGQRQRVVARRLLCGQSRAGEGRAVPRRRRFRRAGRAPSASGACSRLRCALSLAGLPFTGGALAKAASKPLFGHGSPRASRRLSSAGSALLMLHFVQRLPLSWRYEATRSPARARPLLAAAALGALLLPYLSSRSSARFGDALAPSKILDGLWPVARRRRPRARARARRRPPAAHSGRRHDRRLRGGVRPVARRGALFDRAGRRFRRWPAAGLALLARSCLRSSTRRLPAAEPLPRRRSRPALGLEQAHAPPPGPAVRASDVQYVTRLSGPSPATAPRRP